MLAGKRAEIAPSRRQPPKPGADPLNLCGNARGGSSVQDDFTGSRRGARSRSEPGEPPGRLGVELRSLSHSFGELEVLDGVDLEVAEREVVAIVGPSGCGKSTLLELIGGLREPGAGAIAVGGEPEAERASSRCAYMPQRDLLFPWLRAIDNAALALRNRGASKRRGAGRGGAPFPALRPRRVRASRARRALRRDAPAGRVPAHAARRASRCCSSTSRSARSTRSPARRCRSGSRGRCAPSRAPSCSSPTTSRRRSTSPTACSCFRARPGRIVAELAYPAPRGPAHRDGHRARVRRPARAGARRARGGTRMSAGAAGPSRCSRRSRSSSCCSSPGRRRRSGSSSPTRSRSSRT